MHVSTDHSRARARNGAVARQLAHSGDVAIDGIRLNPSQPAPNATVEITLELRETAEFVTPFDPALCNPDPQSLPGTGLTANLEIAPDWTGGTTDSVCIPVYSLSSGTRRRTYSLKAPSLPAGVESETHNIEFSIQQPGLPESRVSRTIRVEEGGFEEPPDNGNGPGADWEQILKLVALIVGLILAISVVGSVS